MFKNKMNQLFEDQKSVHVLYSYDESENYIRQAVNYIQNGIFAGDCVILIENDRLYPFIHNELKTLLTTDQMKMINRINNFDFYYSSGSYHPPAILDYFNKTVQPYLEKEISFRSWAHVEWSSMEDPLHLIEDFEKIVDNAVNQLSFPLICAYKNERMPEYLRNILMETHPYILVEDDLILSEQYPSSTDMK
ncbi:MEDS domain-containing protein [Priestia sp. Y58]|nr:MULTISPECIES: MEDS domain-containing protein [Priestia]MDC7724476.1 MEDS domain-containing protein [Priestia megaterium]MDG0033186.1 MEDS domain-containing protein [Priestia sp. Y58]MDG0062291.1 MEDS domain-containing protein [Priestia sp. P5]UYV55724.1 MEDS domain-containing protein [Priestia megaterium]